MQLDNQTLIEIIRNVVQSSLKPDYTGWIIGIVGILVGCISIGITIAIYIKQTRLSSEFDKIRKESIADSLDWINRSLFYLKGAVRSEMRIVEISKGNDEEKIKIIKNLIGTSHDSRVFLADEIMNEADFLRGSVKPELYNGMRGISNLTKIFVNEETLSETLGNSTQRLEAWQNFGRTIVQHTDELMANILSEKNNFR